VVPSLNDETIRTAVSSWLSDTNAATNDFGPISCWDTSTVTNMDSLFDYFMYCNTNNFNEDISYWDTSRVTSMINMFTGATAFNVNLSSWDVSKVTSMYAMFYLAKSFGQTICWNMAANADVTQIFQYSNGAKFSSTPYPSCL
jgi:surface protein